MSLKTKNLPAASVEQASRPGVLVVVHLFGPDDLVFTGRKRNADIHHRAAVVVRKVETLAHLS